MSKILTSPVKRWPGTITIPDFLTFDQAMAWEEALSNGKKLLPEIEFEYKDDGSIDTSKLTEEHLKFFGMTHSLKYANEALPGIKACVLEWNLKDFDPENFPATPRQSRVDLIGWIISEITKLYKEENEVPNELSPTPSNG
jgi:hypothetical protein